MSALKAHAHSTAATAGVKPQSVDNILYRWLGNLLFSLIVVGYPVFASLSQIIGEAYGEINAIFRVIIAIMSISMIGISFYRKVIRADLLIYTFLAMYSVRLWVDYSYSLFPSVERDSQFYIVSVLLPALAVTSARQWFDEILCLRMLVLIGGIGGALVAYTIDVESVFVVIDDPNARASFEFLNPISVGYHGVFVAAASFILMIKKRDGLTLAYCMPLLIMGGYLLVISGSRGPVVALMFAFVATGITNKTANVSYLIAAVVITVLIAIFGLPEVLHNRFLDAGFDASSTERIYVMDLALALAVENPILGFGYIEPLTGTYPHNLVVEAGMALGVSGAALMIWMQASLVWQARKQARAGAMLLPLIGGAMFANAWISGSLWGSGLFFVVLAMLRDLRHRVDPAVDSGSRRSRPLLRA